MHRIIAHIGDAKCGSSAIQKSLKFCRLELEEKFSLFYRTGALANHALLISLIGEQTSEDPAMIGSRVDEIVDDIRQTLAITGTHIFSAEHFLKIGPKKFSEILNRIGFEDYLVDVICYIRSPDGFYLSSVQQQFKVGGRYTTPDKFARPVSSWLDDWKMHPKTRSLTVKKFSRDALLNQSVISDFDSEVCNLVGLDSLNLPERRANETLSAEQMVVLQWFRLEHLPKHDRLRHPESKKLTRFFFNMNATGMVGNKPELIPAVRQTILDNHMNSFRKISKNYGLEFELLRGSSTNASLYQDAKRPDEESVDGILAILDHELVEDLKRIVDTAYKRFATSNWLTPRSLKRDLMRKYRVENTQFIGALRKYKKEINLAQ
ncbi:MAG: hypothetical protein KUG70_08855 [Rhodobacteraceae bacterium]|nr:hypothetical protein [Paracoccaceae bacterium]